MKRESVTMTTTTHYVICESCRHIFEVYSETTIPGYLVECPKHGEFCAYCLDSFIDKGDFPLNVCPSCNILCSEIIKRQIEKGIERGPNLSFSYLDLPKPFIVIKNDTTGWWIGSEKETP